MSFFFCCIYLFLIIIRPQDWALPQLEALRPVLICQFLSIGLCVVEISTGQIKVPKIKHPWWLLITGLMLSVCMSHLANTYFAGFKFAFIDFGKLYLTFIVLWLNLQTPQRIVFFTQFMLAMCLFIALHCVLMATTGSGFGDQQIALRKISDEGGYVQQVKYYGIFNDPNDTAQILALALPFAVFVTLYYNNIFSWIFGAIASYLIIYGLYATQSRGGYLALAITMFVAFRKLFSTKQFVVLCAIGAFFLVLFLPSRFGAKLLDESMAGRAAFWGEANYAFKSKPIFGVGYKMITDYIEGDRATHNAYVQAYSELGIVGYFFWFTLLAFSFVAVWKIADLIAENQEEKTLILWAKCMVPSLAGTYASSYFLTRTYETPIFVVWAMIAACYTIIGSKLTIPALNTYCYFDAKRLKLWPFLSCASIVFIYLSVLFVNKFK